MSENSILNKKVTLSPDQNISNFISLSEASKETGYHPDYLGFLCRTGKLKGFKISRNWFTTKKDLQEFLKNYKNGISEMTDETGTKIRVHVEPDPKVISEDLPFVEQVEKISVPKPEGASEGTTAYDGSGQQDDLTQQSSNGVVESGVAAALVAEKADLGQLRKQVLDNIVQRVKSLDETVAKIEKDVYEKQPEEKKNEALPVAIVAAAGLDKLSNNFSSNFDFGKSVPSQGTSGKLFAAPDIQKLYSSFIGTNFTKVALGIASLIAIAGFTASVLWGNFAANNKTFDNGVATEITYGNGSGGPVAVLNNATSTQQNGNTTVVYQQNNVTKVLGFDQSLLYSVIDARLNQYLAEGKFKGDPGIQGPMGLTGPAGSGGSSVTYIQPSSGSGTPGSQAAYTYLSADTFNANNATINNLTVQGALNVAGSTSFSNTSITNLTVSASTTFSGITGVIQCLHVDASGLVSGTGTDCGAGSGSGNIATGTPGSFAFYQSSTASISPQSVLFISGSKIGIGTSTPTASLFVLGASSSPTTAVLVVASSSGASYFTVAANGSTTISSLASAGFVKSDPNGSLYVDASSYQPAGSYVTNTYASSTFPSFSYASSTFATASSIVNYWSLNGSSIYNNNGYLVGINSSSPIANLSVVGSSTNPTLPIFTVASSSGSQYLTVTSAGNVGIGTANPNTSLVISGGNSTLFSGWTTPEVVTSNGVTRLVIDSATASSSANSGFGLTVNGFKTFTAAVYRPSGSNFSFTFFNEQLGRDGLFINGDTNNTTINGNTGGSKLSVNGGQSIGASYYTLASPTNGAIIQGNVGIGTSTPLAVLAVNGTSTNPTLPLFTVASSSGAQYFTVNANGSASFASGLASINSSGQINAGRVSSNGFFGLSGNFLAADPVSGGIQLADGSGTTGSASGYYIYNAWTNASNYERGGLSWNSNVLTIGTQAAGTGILRSIDLIGGNVGIGTATPLAVLAISGTSTNPSLPLLTVSSSTGSSLFTVLPNGNVGVGTANPGARLTVDKGAGPGVISQFTNGTYNGYNLFGTTGNFYFAADSGANNSIGVNGNGTTQFYNGGNLSASINGSGNFGINVSNALYKLEVDSLAGVSQLKLTRSGNSQDLIVGTGNFVSGSFTNYRFSAVGGIDFEVGRAFGSAIDSGLKALMITNAGNVGIGTSTPQGLAVIQGSTSSNATLLTVSSSSGTSLFTIAANGSTTISSLGTGLVRSTSGGSLYVDNTSYQPAGSYVTNSYASSTFPSFSYASSTFATASSIVNYWSQNGSSLFNNSGYQVGINSSSPIANLSVVGSSTNPAIPILAVASSSGASYLTVLANGNVGVGTTSPSQLLTVGNNNQFTVDSSGNTVVNAAQIGLTPSLNAYSVTLSGTASPSPTGTYTYAGQSGGHNYYQSGSWYLYYVSGAWRISGTLGSSSSLIPDWFNSSSGSGNSPASGSYTPQDATGNPVLSYNEYVPSASITSVGLVSGSTAQFGSVLNSYAITINGNGNPSPNGAYIYVGIYNTYNYYQLGTSSGNWYLYYAAGAWRISQTLGYSGSAIPDWYTTTPGSGTNPPYNASMTPQDATGNPVILANGYIPAFYINANGNTAIGTSSAPQTLAIQGSGSSDILSVASSSGMSALYINASGNVGIGTTSPLAVLAVNGYASNPTFPLLTVASSSGNSLFTVLPSGKVGIGTGSPVALLTIVGPTSDTVPFYRMTGGSVNLDYYITTSNRAQLGTATNHPLDLFTNNAARLGISPAGGVSIGSTYYSTDAGANNLIVQGNVGIGTTTTNSSLTVAGNITPDVDVSRTLGAATLGYSIVFANSITAPQIAGGGGNTDLNITPNGSTGNVVVNLGNSAGNSAFKIQNASSNRFTVDNNGLVNIYTGNQNGGITITPADGGATATISVNTKSGTDAGTNLQVIASNGGSAAGVNAGGNVVLTPGLGQGGGANGVSYFSRGNVGVGTSTPNLLLSVQNIATTTKDILDIASSSGTSLLRVTALGNVGIGTTTPANALTVNGKIEIDNNSSTPPTDNSGFVLQADNLPGRTDFNSLYVYPKVTGSKNFYFGKPGQGFFAVDFANVATLANLPSINVASGCIGFTDCTAIGMSRSGNALSFIDQFPGDSTNFYSFNFASGEKLRITNSGNVGIGTTSPFSKLDVEGGDLTVGQAATGATNYKINFNRGDTTGYARLLYETGGVEVGAVGTRGDSTIANTVSIDLFGTRGLNIVPPAGYLGGNAPAYARVSVKNMNPQSQFTVGGNAAIGSSYADANAAPANGLLVEGSVGIGTTSPQAALHVYGANFSSAIIDAPTQPDLQINSNGSAIGFIGSGKISGAANTDLGIQAPNKFQIAAGGTVPGLTVSGIGVGIGTSSPNNPLHVYAAGAGGAKFDAGTAPLNIFAINNNQFATFGSAAGALSGGTAIDLAFQTSSGGNILFATNGTALSNIRMTVTSAGNVGIGTTSPRGTLDVTRGNSNTAGDTIGAGVFTDQNYTLVSDSGTLSLQSNDTEAIDKGGSLGFAGRFLSSSSRSATFGIIKGAKENSTDNNLAGYLSFATRAAGGDNVEQMRITSSGNVGIGTTSPTQKLEVAGIIKSDTLSLGTNEIFLNSNTALNIDYTDLANAITFGGTGGRAAAIGPSVSGIRVRSTYGYLWSADADTRTAADTGIFRNSAGAVEINNGTVGQWRDLVLRNFSANTTSTSSVVTIQGASSSPTIPLLTVASSSGSSYLTVLANGNVGIGTTSPSLLLTVGNNNQFTVSSSGNVSNIGQFLAANGSVGAPSYSFSGETNTGFYKSFAGIISYTSAGSEYLEFPRASQNLVVLNSTTGLGFSSGVPSVANPDVQINRFGANTIRVSSDGSNGSANLIVNGNLGIGTTTPSARLSVTGTTAIDPFDLSSTSGASLFRVTQGGNVGIGTSSPNAIFAVAANCSGFATTIAGRCTDYAEIYPASEAVAMGDIVSIDSVNNVITGSTSQDSLVRKSRVGYDKQILGIVSSNPAVVVEGNSVQLMSGGDYHFNPLRPGIALAGRVPVKVTNENGNIEPGDFLTSSENFPGYAMRATHSGEVIGQAVQEFTSATPNDSGQVMTFVKPGYQVVNNIFVLEDDQLSGDAYGGSTTSVATAFLVDQRGSGNILQLQGNDQNRFMVASTGLVSILAQVPSSSLANILTVSNGSSTLFTINSVGDAAFTGHILVAKDTAGTATIHAGDNQTTVTFDAPYSSVPKIVATVNGVPSFFYGVINKTATGFTIAADRAVPADVSFDWVALAQPQDIQSQSSINLNVISSASGSGSSSGSNSPSNNPTPTPTPDAGTASADDGSSGPSADSGSLSGQVAGDSTTVQPTPSPTPTPDQADSTPPPDNGSGDATPPTSQTEVTPIP